MERRGIGTLFASGADLSARLARVANAIEPEIELIEPGARDVTTGLSLQDIWRYARLFWSIPYQSTPGRNLFYLVRDRAAPSRPLIGIAALGNPVLGLSQRDDHFAWSVPGFLRRLLGFTDSQRRAVADQLRAVIARGLEETLWDDILDPNWQADWRAAVRSLSAIERTSANDRLEQLDEAGEMRSAEYQYIRSMHTAADEGKSSQIDWLRISKTALYTRKRAATLADLIQAHGVFSESAFGTRSFGVDQLIKTDQGIHALEIALRRLKQEVIASCVMELITCGAVPPYREVLGGKLVAMLMLSRDVASHFKRRYAGRVSLIASALAGRPITRTARLAVLTTSSLYAFGSSQYNRIRIPFKDEALSYKRIGVTESFGTVHFAPDTVLHLGSVSRLAGDNRRDINNLFGEGTSAKMRLIRGGLEALGLNSSSFLQHHSPRLLYAAGLCSNLEDMLLGLGETPKYVLPAGPRGTEIIVNHWKVRWLSARVSRPDILERLHEQRFEDYRLGLETAREGKITIHAPVVIQGHIDSSQVGAQIQSPPEQSFVERLYRSSKSYADRMSPKEIEAIHVDLGVDKYLLEEASRGKQIVVTGNPGDGKTHLIERLRTKLEKLGARVITDANACSDQEILRAWKASVKDSRPLILAINEWPLYVLQRLSRQQHFTPVDEAIRQVTSARYFVSEQRPDSPKQRVTVIDLSLRNLLSPPVIEAVMDRLTADSYYEGLNRADPVLANRDALRHHQVRTRLVQLLQLVAARTGHVPMRQLIGLVAFLLTGGQPASDRLRIGQDGAASLYSTLAFDGGEGPLFDSVRAVFDPARITHPYWDERLWLGETNPSDWIGQPPPRPATLPESERAEAHRVIKRRFYFEHANGDDLLGLVPRDEIEFERLLGKKEEKPTGIVRDMVLALNRFYEPRSPVDQRERLVLWQSHRYDVRAPLAFVAVHNISHNQLRVEHAKLAQWVEAWLPRAQMDRRSFALVASAAGKDIALLEVDRELYLTLFESHRGLGRASWSRTATRRITRFVDQIHGAVEKQSDVEDIRVRNVDSELDERFAIQRLPSRYQL
jgi:hypothetical protein